MLSCTETMKYGDPRPDQTSKHAKSRQVVDRTVHFDTIAKQWEEKMPLDQSHACSGFLVCL